MATLFTWGVAAAGAALVFFTETVKPKLMDSMLGFAVGVAFGAVAAHLPAATLGGTIALAIGIGLQNFYVFTVIDVNQLVTNRFTTERSVVR